MSININQTSWVNHDQGLVTNDSIKRAVAVIAPFESGLSDDDGGDDGQDDNHVLPFKEVGVLGLADETRPHHDGAEALLLDGP